MLLGGSAADRLDGGSENDLLLGSGGADTLIGGAGADHFVYTSTSDSMIGAADTIEGFESGVDRIDLRALAPSSVMLGTSGAFTTVTAQTAAGTVTILVTGSVSLSDVDIVPRGSLITGTGIGDTLIATIASSEIRGDAGDDTLIGTSANDRLDGRTGCDFMVGGSGNDTYVIDNQADHTFERTGGGVDQVLAYAGFTLAEGIENATLMAPVTVFGNWLDNVIHGSSGDDVIFAGGGNDVLVGGLGADSLSGGLGTDLFIYRSAADSGPVTFDRISGFEYGADKIDLIGINVLSISWTRVLNMWDSYEEVTIQTPGGPMVIRVDILNIATSGISLSDFIYSSHDPRNDFNGDGRSDILWRSDTGAFSNWLGTATGGWQNNDANGASYAPTSWHIVGTGDFNGDHRDDILWRSDSGALSNWLATANGGWQNNDASAATSASISWHVAGVGDFNGDNRDDILWRGDTGALSNWLSTASGGWQNNDANAASSAPTNWQIAAVGDFNGDGRDDILWRNSSGAFSNWLATASGGWQNNDANGASFAPTSWHIVGVGDFNGDTRDDILWRSDTGALSNWLATANGGWQNNDVNAASSAPTSWHIASIGDFNGDNRDDILWRSDTGALSNWLSTANGGWLNNDVNANSAAPMSWHVTAPDTFWV